MYSTPNPVLLTARPVLDFPSAQVTEAMNRSFEEYFVPLVFTPETFERRFRSEHLDAQASKLWFAGEELVGLVLIARRGYTSRVAAMGLVIDARGKGYGKQMLQAALDEARARHDRSMLLEVFVPNERARRLYERLGFRNTRELFTFRREPQPVEVAAQLTEVDPRQVAYLVAREAAENLPWMFAAESLMAASAPTRAFSLDDKAFVILRPEAERTLVQTVIVPKAHRRQGWGRRLLQAVETAFPGPPLTMPMVTQGPGYDFLWAAGWEPLELALFEMECPLA
ncbi:GNAT family N-acetyltransferase [Hymenobacter chitinivorans]|uniref:Acetyltransferase (GNAT) family protein n=1 Tax=Hymenobacter chitinivorans DSM 11115 TaxID=1121954 RepID=A0A2M9BQJ4_9BACT|nr:GNAT family N-acetyltransferase [Hymenobacter chitinivorans]PJJ60187.1 acetyltransferase (GNAT) family protein [Hymenobacter chitinivorans DSM 11115]